MFTTKSGGDVWMVICWPDSTTVPFTLMVAELFSAVAVREKLRGYPSNVTEYTVMFGEKDGENCAFGIESALRLAFDWKSLPESNKPQDAATSMRTKHK